MTTRLFDDQYLLSSDELSQPFDFSALFKQDCPVEIEIGTGKGRLILSEAQRRRDTCFLGIEKVPKFVRITAERLSRLGLKNVRLVREHAGYVVHRLVPENSISVYHIYFPDPWPKRRHHKRRLINPDFSRRLHETLIPNGRLLVATDHKEYFAWILRALDTIEGWSHKEVWSEAARGPSETEATHYEVKYSSEARIVHRLMYAKSSE